MPWYRWRRRRQSRSSTEPARTNRHWQAPARAGRHWQARAEAVPGLRLSTRNETSPLRVGEASAYKTGLRLEGRGGRLAAASELPGCQRKPLRRPRFAEAGPNRPKRAGCPQKRKTRVPPRWRGGALFMRGRPGYGPRRNGPNRQAPPRTGKYRPEQIGTGRHWQARAKAVPGLRLSTRDETSPLRAGEASAYKTGLRLEGRGGRLWTASELPGCQREMRAAFSRRNGRGGPRIRCVRERYNR